MPISLHLLRSMCNGFVITLVEQTYALSFDDLTKDGGSLAVIRAPLHHYYYTV